MSAPGRAPVYVLLVAHIASMLGFATYAALLPELRDAWRMSNAQAGIVGGMFFAGYIGTVSLWTALTDRVDARKIYVAGAALSAAGSAGFGVIVSGFGSAVLFQALLGAGIAATYMPGLRLLSERISGPTQSRYVAFYTSFFGIGTALSLAMAGFIAPAYGWHTAFIASAFGPLLAGTLVLVLIAPLPARGDERLSMRALFPLRAWQQVLRERASAGYTLGYAVHCLELFGSRAWMVAYLAYAASLQEADAFPWPAAAIAAAVNLLAVPASIVGNEVALRIGRRRWILLVMAASGTTGIVLGAAPAAPWPFVLALLIVYSMLVMAESGTLTAGLVATAPAELRGAAMGLYSLTGFAGGLAGPVVFGAALDLGGGAAARGAWIAGYAAIGVGCLAAPIVARIAAHRRPG
ncbi:MAG TPA: MFS transporter [Burkholderiales bacterium]|nr:MFS transporter [Burkholderiales bacterium]